MIRTPNYPESVTLPSGFVTLQKWLNSALGAGCDTVTLDFPVLSPARTHTYTLLFLLSYCHKTLEAACLAGCSRDTRYMAANAYCHGLKNEGGEV